MTILMAMVMNMTTATRMPPTPTPIIRWVP